MRIIDKMQPAVRTIMFLSFFLLQSILIAEIKLPGIIGDYMVIQQNAEVPIWGWAESKEVVTLEGSWDRDAISTIADEEGRWHVDLQSPDTGGPHTITIKGKEDTVILNNILSGEVWLASGQSNMAMALKVCENAETEVEEANYPDIRIFHVEHTSATEPQSDCNGNWEVCTPETAKDFSGVAYFFGRKLHSHLDVPVGLISASKGGSPAEAWLAENYLKSDTALHSIFDMWERWETDYPESELKYRDELEAWGKERNLSDSLLKPAPAEPSVPVPIDMIGKPHRRPGALYNAMIAPVIPFAIRGVIWYQGESNVSRPVQYEQLFGTLITNWREEWRLGEFPFYYVQIAPYHYKDNLLNASLLRESQMKVMSIPNTGMVVTTDIGDLQDIHPTTKREVGSRLGLWALSKTYGYDDMVYSGPVFDSMKVEGDTIRLYFEHAGSGLVCRGDSLKSFEMAGSDKKFVKANAVIDGSTVLVFHEHLKKPVAVRFGWMITSLPNFYNSEGLPAAPFRTDQWNQLQ